MARFLFTQSLCMELITKDGKPSGGAIIATLVWMKALHELGHEVLLAKLENDNRLVLDEFRWIKTYPIYHPNKGLPKLRWVTYRFPKFIMVLKRSKSDYLVESIPTWTSVLNGIVCKIFKIKQIIRIANDNMLDERIKLTHNFFDQKFISLGFRFSDFILTQNDFQFSQLRKKLPNKQIVKLSNPIILDDIKSKAVDCEYKYIAWLANFRYQKNLKLLFNIAKRLPDELFKVAGAPLFPLDSETEEYLSKLEELPNIEFLGTLSRQEISQFLSKARYLLNTSRYEGFSNTFLESMLVGTPILTTGNVNPDGIILNFDLGIIYNNEHDFEEKISNVSVSDYFKKSKNCINYVQENHDHRKLGEKLLYFLKAGKNYSY